MKRRYLAFFDESGDSNLKTIDPKFPVFCLFCCLINEAEYTKNVIPIFAKLKIKYWGHDGAILHEKDIRRGEGDFRIFRASQEMRDSFMGDLTEIIESAFYADFIAIVINKNDLINKYKKPFDPYNVALAFCLEKIATHIEGEASVNAIFEARGKSEDALLLQEFHRIMGSGVGWGYKVTNFGGLEITPYFVEKWRNNIGLQIADLCARPIAMKFINPTQENKAFDAIDFRTIDGVLGEIDIKSFPRTKKTNRL